MPKPKDVDDYLARLSDEQQTQFTRTIVNLQKMCPELTDEDIRHQAFRLIKGPSAGVGFSTYKSDQ